jgi:predicted CXXCH cytochrome family protein
VSRSGVLGGDWLTSVGPNSYLLKAPSATELCLSCHDGQSFAPDVVDSDSYGLTERSAGHFAALETPNYKGHKISRDPGGKAGSSELCDRCHFAGSFGTASVACTDCHNPHGNGYYRNLWWASEPGGEPPILASIRGGVAGRARYEATNVGYPAPSGGTWVEVTNMCIDCHHTFFGPYYTDNGEWPGGFSPYHRHPGTNTEWGGSYPINRTAAHTDPTNWVNGGAGFTVRRLPFAVVGATDFSTATTVAATNQVFCLSCHKAHGSENPFSLRWDYGSGSATAQAGCRQCHNNVFSE